MIRPHYLNHFQLIKSMTERRVTVNTVMDQLTRQGKKQSTSYLNAYDPPVHYLYQRTLAATVRLDLMDNLLVKMACISPA